MSTKTAAQITAEHTGPFTIEIGFSMIEANEDEGIEEHLTSMTVYLRDGDNQTIMEQRVTEFDRTPDLDYIEIDGARAIEHWPFRLGNGRGDTGTTTDSDGELLQGLVYDAEPRTA